MDISEFLDNPEDFFGDADELREAGAVTIDSLPGTFLHKAALKNAIPVESIYRDRLGVPNFYSYLFTGPRGTGKHTLADSLIYTICSENDGIEIGAFLAEDFPENISHEEIEMLLSTLFTEARRHSCACLVFDQMDRYAELDFVMAKMAENYEECLLEDGSSNVYLVCIADAQITVDRNLLLMPSCPQLKMYRCCCNLPTAHQRKEYLRNKLSWEVPNWETSADMLEVSVNVELTFTDYSIDELTDDTQGFSYEELNMLILYMQETVSGIKYAADSPVKVPVSRDTVLDYIACIHPKEAAASASAGFNMGELVSALGKLTAGSAQSSMGKMKEISSKDPDDMSFEERLEYIESIQPIS